MGRITEGTRLKTSRFYPFQRLPWNVRNKQRTSMSFFIVVIFFVVFGMILFTEVFVINDRNRAGSFSVRSGLFVYHSNQDKTDYEEIIQSDNFPQNLEAGIEALINSEQQKTAGNSLPNILDNTVANGLTHTASLSDGVWQAVTGPPNKFFVYSAYFDRRDAFHAVRIIAAAKTRGAPAVFCRFWYQIMDKNSTKYISTNTTASVKIIRENWNLKYSAAYVLCPVKKGQPIPWAVSVYSKTTPHFHNLLLVNNFNNESQLATNKYAICVKPLHYNYDKMIQIVEFIELNRILGVQHFIFYNHTVGPQVDCLLREYIARGIVTLLSWDLDIPSQKEIRTEGLFAALNDCLYRTMYRFSHVLFIDFDEYIIPRTKRTLPELIDDIQSKRKGPSVGAYSFQNAFFYLQWQDDESVAETQDPILANLVTQKKTRRKSKLHPHKQRSKYICRPEKVVEVGNHFVWEFSKGFTTFNVPADQGILHHYRICEFGGDDCVKQASTVDRTAFNYRTELLNAVSDVYETYKEKCDLQELYSESQQIAAVPFIDILQNDFKKMLNDKKR